MKHSRYYIESAEDNPLVIWRVDVEGLVAAGMNDSPFTLSNLPEEALRLADSVRRISKREAKSLFPALFK